MILSEARRMIVQEMCKFRELEDWDFVISKKAKKRFGCCKYSTQELIFSESFILLNDEQKVMEVILHEIAHALTPGDGHGPLWKRACRRLGIEPSRLVYEAQREYNYAALCNGCEKVFMRTIAPKRGGRYNCRKCGREKGKLTWFSVNK